MNGCYATSCICAPFRAVAKCFSCKKTTTKSQKSTYDVSIAIIIQPIAPTHHKERTWKLSNGKMSYER